MRKKIISIFVLVSVMLCVCAADIETVLEKAKSLSTVYQGYEISNENHIISDQKADLKGPEFTVTGGLGYNKDNTYVDSSSLTLTFPETDNNYKFTLRANVGRISLRKKDPFTVSPSLTIDKNMTFKSYVDTRDEIKDLASDINWQKNYITNITNFENNLINTVASILNAENRLKTSETNYKRTLTTYENDKYLGTIEEGSLPDIARKLSLDTQRVQLESSRTSYEKSLRDFEHQYGFAFEEITQVRDADLDFEMDEDGNSTVLLAAMDLETAKQNLNAAKGMKKTVSISTTATAPYTFNNKYDNGRLDLSASVTYKETPESSSSVLGGSDKFKLTMTVNESIGRDTNGKDISPVPSVSISGTWSSKAVQAESDELNIKTLTNTVLEKENAYNDALYTYRTNAQTLLNDIATHKNSVSQNEIQTDYDKAVLDYQEKLLENGLTTQQTVDDARTTYESDLLNAMVLKLQALVLENRIKIIEL